MEWASIIALAIKAVAGLADYLSNRQLLEAGKAKVISQGLKQTLDNLEKAKSVKQELTGNPSSDYADKLRAKYERTDE